MSPATHQTIRLGRGKHHAPEEGACVMELASMLAGEDFSDHPISVCPVIGSLLRAHNDSIDEQRRQDLYAYAAKVVGSRSSSAVQDARAARLIAWSRAVKRRQAAQSRLPRGLRSAGRLVKLIFAETHSHAFYRLTEHNDETHAEVLALLDELLAITPERVRVPDELDAVDAREPAPVSSRR